MSSPTSLDHLILFLPQAPGTPSPEIPPFFSKHFTLFPGGTHADNLTANTLILLQDGCYIELICFLPSPENTQAIQNHWWGPDVRRKGWADWCLTSESAEQNSERLKESGKETHVKPVYGGRKRPDGKDVKWSVTFPVGENGGQSERGRVPFFCHDVTDRTLRVPVDEERTRHPSGVVGVKEINVLVKDSKNLEELGITYESVLGVQGSRDGELIVYEVGRVHAVGEVKEGPKVVLRLASSDEEKRKVEEKGFCFGNVVLSALVDEGQELGTRRRIDGHDDDDLGGLWIEYGN